MELLKILKLSTLPAVVDKYALLAAQKLRDHDCPWPCGEIGLEIFERDYWLKRARKSGKK